MHFDYSTPFDAMHLIYGHLAPEMVQILRGTYKDLDEGNRDYVLPEITFARYQTS